MTVKPKAPKRVETVYARARCQDCPKQFSGTSPQGSAALHSKATGHTTTAQVSMKMTYGPGALEENNG